MERGNEIGKMPWLRCEEGRIIELDEKTRRVKHVISTGKLDRGNRIVEPRGWRLARFRRNPVVLADHDYSIERIIGRAVETRIENDALVSTTEFAKDGLGNFAFRLVQAVLAKAWSVGWLGIKRHAIGEKEDCDACNAAGGSKVRWGVHYTAQELLEYSLVAVPANPDAVMGLQAAGLIGSDEREEWVRLTGASVPDRSSGSYAVDPEARRAAALRASQRIRQLSGARGHG